jgi:hypothetical protein
MRGHERLVTASPLGVHRMAVFGGVGCMFIASLLVGSMSKSGLVECDEVVCLSRG